MIQDLFDIPAKVRRIDIHRDAKIVKFASYRVVSLFLHTPPARQATIDLGSNQGTRRSRHPPLKYRIASLLNAGQRNAAVGKLRAVGI